MSKGRAGRAVPSPHADGPAPRGGAQPKAHAQNLSMPFTTVAGTGASSSGAAQ